MTPIQQSYRRRLINVLTYIQDHLDSSLELETLARVAGFSPFHFHRIFLAMTGETVAAHIRRLRLAKAAWRLEYSDLSVIDSAMEAGYETPEAFCRAFKAQYGEAPSLFRGRSRQRRRQQLAQLFPEMGTKGQHPRSPLALKVVLSHKPAYRVASIRALGPYETSGPEAWKRMEAWAVAHHRFTPQTLCIGIAHDDPSTVPEEKLRYDACITIGPDIGPDDEIGVTEIPGGEYATIVHKGPHDQLEKTYLWLYGVWLPESGREVAIRPSYEIFLNYPGSTPPEELLTEINMPLLEKHV